MYEENTFELYAYLFYLTAWGAAVDAIMDRDGEEDGTGSVITDSLILKEPIISKAVGRNVEKLGVSAR